MGQIRKVTTGKTQERSKPAYRREGNLLIVTQWGRASDALPALMRQSPRAETDHACYIVVISPHMGVTKWTIGCVKASLTNESHNDATIAACRARGGWIVLDAPPGAPVPRPLRGPISTREMRTIAIAHAEEIARQLPEDTRRQLKGYDAKTVILKLQELKDTDVKNGDLLDDGEEELDEGDFVNDAD